MMNAHRISLSAMRIRFDVMVWSVADMHPMVVMPGPMAVMPVVIVVREHRHCCA